MFWTRSVLLSLSNALFITMTRSKQVTCSNTASEGQEQENLGTGSDLPFTGSNRQEKTKATEEENVIESKVQKVANSNLWDHCSAVISRQSFTTQRNNRPQSGVRVWELAHTVAAYNREEYSSSLTEHWVSAQHCKEFCRLTGSPLASAPVLGD